MTEKIIEKEKLARVITGEEVLCCICHDTYPKSKMSKCHERSMRSVCDICCRKCENKTLTIKELR